RENQRDNDTDRYELSGSMQASRGGGRTKARARSPSINYGLPVRRVCETRGVAARLVTIPISHFCEKARWALDRAGVEYVEHPHLQLVHVVAARLAGGGRTVPVLVTDEGEVLGE